MKDLRKTNDLLSREEMRQVQGGEFKDEGLCGGFNTLCISNRGCCEGLYCEFGVDPHYGRCTY